MNWLSVSPVGGATIDPFLPKSLQPASIAQGSSGACAVAVALGLAAGSMCASSASRLLIVAAASAPAAD